MKVGWLIDQEMFEVYRDDLVAAIRQQGHEVRLIRPPAPPYRWDDVGCSYRETFTAEACVVCHGDIELVTPVHREQRWMPGVFATVENYACSNYYCYFSEYLLNNRYVMLPFGELHRCKEFLMETVGESGRIFVRPDSPLKLFTGQVMTDTSFDADYEYMGFYEFPKSSIVVVSRPFEIEAEWRFVVVDQAVVAGSLYKRQGKSELRADYDQLAFELAKKVASLPYQPDRVWVMDICKTADGYYKLLEIGGFSFADLYLTDKNAVVAAVSRAAVAAWAATQ